MDQRLKTGGELKRLNQKGVEIHARSAFLQGLFFLSESQIKTAFGDAVPYLNKLKSVASQIDLTLSELSLLWLVSLSEISEVVIGVDNADQLKAHLHTLTKNVDPAVFDEALSVKYENNNILNPSLWP